MTEPAWTTLELAWSLRERVDAVFHKPLHELGATIARAADPTVAADSNDPARFQRACMLGMAGVTDLALDEKLPEPGRAALRELPTHYQELLNTLQPAVQAISAASPDLRNIQHFEGVTGLLQGAAQAANPSTPVGVAAIGGATLGTLVLPGIGTAIGGAIGLWLGGKQVSKRDRLALQRFAAATKLMWSAVDDLHRALWNQIIRSIHQKGGSSLPDAAYFDTADVRWSGTPKPSERSAAQQHLETYLREWGPHPNALDFAARLCLPPYPLDLPGLEKWVTVHRQLYPSDPSGHANAARLALEKGDPTEALAAATRGIEIEANHAAAREVRLEALAALGRISEAEEAVRLTRQQGILATPELALIRGLERGGRRSEAVERVRAWAQRDGRPAAIARHLAAFAPTAALLAVPIPELAQVPPGLEGMLQAVVEENLHADGVKSFLGAPPPQKMHSAQEAWLNLAPEERLLFLYDWSLWHNAKTGLAITTKRLLWKCAWEDRVSIAVKDISAIHVSADQSVLRLGERTTVDVEDVQLAASLARTLQAMLQVITP